MIFHRANRLWARGRVTNQPLPPVRLRTKANAVSSARTSYLLDAVAQAMQRAARSDSENNWLEKELHLPPWQVSKLFSSTSSSSADFTITADQPLKDSGLSIADVLGPTVGFTSALNDVLVHQQVGVRCLQAANGTAQTRSQLFHIQDRHPESTRPVDLSKVGNLQLVMGRVHRDKAWQTLANNPLDPDEELTVWTKKLESILEKTPKHESGLAMLRLSDQNMRQQRWQRWQSVLDKGVTLLPQTDAARTSSLLILKYAASDERLAWERNAQTRESTERGVQVAAATNPAQPLANAWNTTPFEADHANATANAAKRINPKLASANVGPNGNSSQRISDTTQRISDQLNPNPQASDAQLGGRPMRSAVVPASASTSINGTAPATGVYQASAVAAVDERLAAKQAALEMAVQHYNKVMESDRSMALRPDMQLAQFARRRALAELGVQPTPDVGGLQLMATGSHLPGWQQVAEQETALFTGRGTLPPWTMRARRTAEPPRLDGRDDDVCWRAAEAVALTSPFHNDSNAKPTLVKFSYDEEYLYLFMQCPKMHQATGEIPESHSENRSYDMMSLQGNDFVQVTLDTDRDYTSACELSVDSHGHTFDRCCEVQQWNPSWYVYVNRDSQAWQSECAIRLADLTTASSLQGRAWAISLFRFIPEWDVQSWSQLRSYNPRLQGNGLLLFDP